VPTWEGAGSLVVVAADTIAADDAPGHLEEYERILTRWYVAWHLADAITMTLSTLGNLRRFRRPKAAVAAAVLGVGHLVWSAYATTKTRRVTRQQAWIDTCAACLLALSTHTTTYQDDTDRWRNWPHDHLVFHSEIVGVGLLSRPERLAATSLMYATVALRNHRRGIRPQDTLAEGLTMIAKSIIMHGFADLTRHLARRLETADREALDEAARLGRARIRSRHHRSAHERAVRGLRRIALSADPADTALRTACAGDAAHLRSVLMHEDGCPAQTALIEVVESVSTRGINVELVIGDIRAVPETAARTLARQVAGAMSQLPSGARLVLHADCEGRIARAGLHVSPADETAEATDTDLAVTW